LGDLNTLKTTGLLTDFQTLGHLSYLPSTFSQGSGTFNWVTWSVPVGIFGKQVSFDRMRSLYISHRSLLPTDIITLTFINLTMTFI
jgi:hypothetical protein